MSEQEQQSKDGGFVLPPPNDAPATNTDASTNTNPGVAVPVTMNLGQSDTSSRDLLIGGGILVVLLVAFFFVRGSYANMLVRKRVPPGKANAFGGRADIMACIAPLGAVAVVALILMLVSGRR